PGYRNNRSTGRVVSGLVLTFQNMLDQDPTLLVQILCFLLGVVRRIYYSRFFYVGTWTDWIKISQSCEKKREKTINTYFVLFFQYLAQIRTFAVAKTHMVFRAYSSV